MTTPFELALLRMLRRHLDCHFSDLPSAAAQGRSLKGLTRECGVLLSVLAHLGHDGEKAATNAFEAGMSELGLQMVPAMKQPDAMDLSMLNAPLDRLAQLVTTGP